MGDGGVPIQDDPEFDDDLIRPTGPEAGSTGHSEPVSVTRNLRAPRERVADRVTARRLPMACVRFMKT